MIFCYNIVYAYYCDRTNLNNMLSNYKKNSQKSYINALCELFAEHNDSDYLSKIFELCTDAIILSVGKHVIENTVYGGLLINDTKVNNTEVKQKIMIEHITNGSLHHKLITNFALENGIKIVNNYDGIKLDFYIDEFLYRQKKIVANLYQKARDDMYIKIQSIEISDDYKKFLQNIEKIKILTTEFQVFFWQRLFFVSSSEQDNTVFEKLHAECKEEILTNLRINEMVTRHKILTGIDKIEFEEVKTLCEKLGKFELANVYINKLMDINPNSAEKVINAHRYLFSYDSSFLRTYLRLKKGINPVANFSASKFLNEYNTKYENDLTYKILSTFYMSKNKNFKKSFINHVSWLEENINKCNKPLAIL